MTTVTPTPYIFLWFSVSVADARSDNSKGNNMFLVSGAAIFMIGRANLLLHD